MHILIQNASIRSKWTEKILTDYFVIPKFSTNPEEETTKAVTNAKK